MEQHEKERREELLAYCLKTRNIYKIREVLMENLLEGQGDQDFLLACYELVKQDALVFQPHNHQPLNYQLEEWTEADFQRIVVELSYNFSQMRYYLALQVQAYFYKVMKEEEEAKIKEEEAEKERLERKKIRNRLKKLKWKKRKRSEKERYMLTAIHVTYGMLIIMIIQLICAPD